MGGDFRQILPVVLNGGKVEILATSLKESYLWSSVQRFKLIQRMRVNDSPEKKDFAKFLIQLGEGKISSHANKLYDDLIQIYPTICSDNSQFDLPFPFL